MDLVILLSAIRYMLILSGRLHPLGIHHRPQTSATLVIHTPDSW